MYVAVHLQLQLTFDPELGFMQFNLLVDLLSERRPCVHIFLKTISRLCHSF